MTLWYDLSLSTLLSNTVVRMGMNAIMVLAMVPGIQCGSSLNLGRPIGLEAGLLGGLLTIELGLPGWGGDCGWRCACGCLRIRIRSYVKPAEGFRNVRYYIRWIFHRLPDVYRLACASVPVSEAALAAWNRTS